MAKALTITRLGQLKQKFKSFSTKPKNSKDPENHFKKLRKKRDPFALNARLGGSTVDFVVTGLDDEKKPKHFVFDLSKISKTKAIDTLYKIISFVSEQAKRIGQKVLPITFGIAGAETQKHHKLFEKEGKTLPTTPKHRALHITPNTQYDPPRVSNCDHPQANSLINFMDDLINALTKRRLKKDVDYKLHYQDEVGTIEPKSTADIMQINFTVINDTLAIANSIVSELQDGQNVFSMVSGSGFNVGLSSNFDSRDNSFKTVQNTEFGHVDLRTDKYSDLLSKLDKATLEAGYIESLTPDKLFSAGPTGRELNHGVEAKIDYLQGATVQDQRTVLAPLAVEYNFDIDKVLKSPLLTAGESHKPKDIMTASQEGDQLAKLLLLDLATKLGKLLNLEYGEFIKDSNTKDFVITGSFFENLCKQQDLKNAFVEALNSGREENLQISFLEKDQMDGLKALIEKQCSLLKT